ncbi:hypothetical protein RJ639_036631 [Escallonia herrerae]|uniref:Uncharacterized protein n=1 Tax=Escallonia herrerae TaxID=1293975 RepID=A0AA88WPQ8_9ASTE|nr:hypothetical protein RJ639_036631 [Escallonia herrerae]
MTNFGIPTVDLSLFFYEGNKDGKEKEIKMVLTNNKITCALHRVVSPKGRSRHSFVYGYSIEGNTWVEPLSQFTQETGPKYRGYVQKEYLGLKAETEGSSTIKK